MGFTSASPPATRALLMFCGGGDDVALLKRLHWGAVSRRDIHWSSRKTCCGQCRKKRGPIRHMNKTGKAAGVALVGMKPRIVLYCF